jgi:protein-S-isoprenylcysteine O-methyltransferase Ste14
MAMTRDVPTEKTPAFTGKPDAPNIGLLRPPLVYLSAILAGVALDFICPLGFLPSELRAVTGVPLVLAALVLFWLSIRRFKLAGTPVPGNKPTTAIVRSGPYRFSRNPIYLAFSVLLLGLACLLDSPWMLGTLAAALALMTGVVIPREERYLERKFGAEYLGYKARVRRWF